jgi:hypothetical protein
MAQKKKIRSTPLLIQLVKRTVMLLVALCMLSVFLYGLGTRIVFMDMTQLWLLRSISLLGLLMGIGASYGFLLDLGYMLFSRQPHFIWGALTYIAVSSFGIIAAGIANLILIAVSGTGP